MNDMSKTKLKTEGAVDVGSNRLLCELTLTIDEIRDLAQFAGMVIKGELTAAEKEDERETEITISMWPAKGVQDDDGQVPPYKHTACFAEYPEEGCIPLGSPNEQITATY